MPTGRRTDAAVTDAACRVTLTGTTFERGIGGSVLPPQVALTLEKLRDCATEKKPSSTGLCGRRWRSARSRPSAFAAATVIKGPMISRDTTFST